MPLQQPTIHLYGASGKHAGDLQGRGIFQGMHIVPVEAGDAMPDEAPSASVVVVPIQAAKAMVSSIITTHGTHHPIVDCSGVMRSINTGIPFGYGQVSQFHLLAGPGIQQNLRVATVRGEVRNRVFEMMCLASESLGARIIATDTEEHDVAMSIIQGLTHALVLCLREKGKLSHDLKERHSITPSGTGSDMITFNAHTKPNVREFLRSGSTLPQALTSHLQKLEEYLVSKGHKLDDFMTAFFRLFYTHIQQGDFDTVTIAEIETQMLGIIDLDSETLRERIEASKMI